MCVKKMSKTNVYFISTKPEICQPVIIIKVNYWSVDYTTVVLIDFFIVFA